MEVDELETSAGEVALDVEVSSSQWSPRRPTSGPGPGRILFVDGVRRVEGHVWIDAGDGTVHSGICASHAAGAIRCDGEARLANSAVERGLFSSSPLAVDIATSAGTFKACMANGKGPAHLSLALQQAMGRSEVRAADDVCRTEECDMVVVDGPLRNRAHLVNSIGLVKTHHVAYLPEPQNRIVAELAPGERTPIFSLGTSWTRLSWYLRLPGGTGSPWAGVVRCECTPDLSSGEATTRADATALALPRFASEPHKDPRAPQNLYPIGALERELRRRLGDPQLIYRALRRAAQTSRIEQDGRPVLPRRESDART